MNRRPRFILIDLDDTLLDERTASRQAFGAFVQAHGELLKTSTEAELFARWRVIAARHWQRYERGEIGCREQRRRRIREFLGAELSDAEADEAFRPYLQAYEAAWTLFPDVADFLERTGDIPKAIVTNGDRTQQRRKVAVTGLGEHVAGIVTPEDCGYWKPHRAMFEAAVRLLGAQTADCLMIGDDEQRDIAPARVLGMAWFHVEREKAHGGLEHAWAHADEPIAK
ncbi:HAD family hydrolase [Methylococcus sp. EFPC2]|uniref:HAD family hydrolase n=1 Tax=Methylococcus sp. EFPC2 TaxID=2812648 RepID=UPI0019680BAB|nr:HAD family hydrolase [Methylococcus sp. EFPC2]QSA98428.1 HAD family hydrolase [Methylococcus sp. EFPC2]